MRAVPSSATSWCCCEDGRGHAHSRLYRNAGMVFLKELVSLEMDLWRHVFYKCLGTLYPGQDKVYIAIMTPLDTRVGETYNFDYEGTHVNIHIHHLM